MMTKAGTTIWSPALARDADEPIHAQLLRALEADVQAGALRPGDRLPTHRGLADRLGIGVATVTRAYAEAERRGLIQSRVGSGSFIGAPQGASPEPQGLIDLAHNVSPGGPAARRLKAAMTQLGRRSDLADQLSYAPVAGFEDHRRAGAAWLRLCSGIAAPDWRRLAVTVGAQQALALTFAALCRPGETIMTEAATFLGVRRLARQAGYHLVGLPMDDEGLTVEGLEQAARGGAKTLYVTPTLHNPTGRTLGEARRARIAAAARALDLWIVEDGVYGAFAADQRTALAELAPERTFHVSGVSKVFGPGLRTGYLLAPDAIWLERILGAMRADCYAPPALGPAIASQWIDDGEVSAILAETRAEIGRRRGLAHAVLGERIDPAPGGPHAWLPMPELEAERIAGLALRAGVEVTPPSAPVVDPRLASGLRLCLGSPAREADLRRGLEVVAGLLEGGAPTFRDAV